MKPSSRQSLLISAGLILLVLTAFEPVRHNSFVEFDDNQYLMENTHVQAGLSVASVRWAFTSGYASNWHPLTWLSHMADFELFDLTPLGHHLHNVLLHAFATVLLFLVLKNMTGAVRRSAFVAVLFGVHPLHVESVAWAAERKDVLCAVFWMLTIAAYVGYARRGGVRRYLLVVLCLVLGLMAKPMIVSLPVVLLVLDFWPLNRMNYCHARSLNDSTIQRFNDSTIQRLIAEKVPLFAVVAVSCVITYLVQQHGKSMTPDLPLSFRIANALNSYVAYSGKLFWPANLGVLYPYPVSWPLWKPAAALLILVLVSALVRSQRSQHPYLATGWLWYLVSLIPVIGIVQVGAQSMADRYAYLPSIGIFIMVAWGAAALSANWRYQRAALTMSAAVIVVLLTVVTRAQATWWKDSVTLFERAVAVTRNNYAMHHSLGWALARENRLDEAAFHLGRSLELRPDPETRLDLADVLIKRQQFDEALIQLRQVLDTHPTNAIAHYDLGIILQARGKPDEAIVAYELAARFDANHSGALNNLGILKIEKGLLGEAAGCFRQSLRIAPGKAATHCNLAAVLLLQSQPEEAVSHYRAALHIDPTNDEACWNLAYTLHGLGNLREAAEYDRFTLRLNPDHVRALNDLAWILATTPDHEFQNPAEAIVLARKACHLTESKDAAIVDTLAAAYASARRFKEATDAAQHALYLAKTAGHEEPDIEKRLRLYQSSMPYVERIVEPLNR